MTVMVISLFLAAVSVSQSQSIVTTVATLPVSPGNVNYVGNRAPLAPKALIKLPVGSIRAKGWLQEYLKRQRDGLTGHLPEISKWLKKDGNAWLAKDGKGTAGWEEVPYWLKGYISLAFQLNDPKMIAESKAWIEAAIASQRPNGDFGPDQRFNDGTRDFWANMLMLNCLGTYYEATGDHRVLNLMGGFFQFQLTVPDKEFLTGYWQRIRGGDNLSSIYWLYNQTGEADLLKLAKKNHERTANWAMKGTLPDWHNVNVAQAFDEPAIYFQQSKDKTHLLAAYENFSVMRQKYGQVPGGMFGADENAREGMDDPRQAIETCGMVEQMFSDEELFGITGDIKWADHCEEVAFNTYPVATMPDFKSLRYLTAPNMASSDRISHAPGYQNGGPMTMMNPLSHRCCQHNHAFGWPYFAEHLWMATNDNGVAAAMYNASDLSVKVGDSTIAKIYERTNYPFEEAIGFSMDLGAKQARFPLYLRIPAWCSSPTVSLNGKTLALPKTTRGFIRIERKWRTKDHIKLNLPMRLATKFWTGNKNAASVSYGPLTFSLKIKEQIIKAESRTTALGEAQWQPDLNFSNWPSYEIFPATAWNFALSLNPTAPTSNLKVVRKPWPKSNFPFTLADVPISIVAKGAELPEWQLDRYKLVSVLQPSPTKTTRPIKAIELIPMGAARIRITAFPWISKDGKAWKSLPAPLPFRPTASHVFENDDVNAVCDQILPKSSGDHSIPRFTWWPHKGTEEWLEYRFDAPKLVSTVGVYWFDDSGNGECRVPKSWSVQGQIGGKWVDLTPLNPATVEKNKFNVVKIAPTTVGGLRIAAKLQDGFSAGILECQVR